MRQQLPIASFACIFCLVLAGLAGQLLTSAAAQASPWNVESASGVQRGIVILEDHPWGRYCSVWDASGEAALVGEVARPNGDDFGGWLVSKYGSTYPATVTTLGYIFKSSSTRFVLGRTVKGTKVARALRTKAGTWIVQRRVNGAFRRWGRVQKGCPGMWALGAARLLLW